MSDIRSERDEVYARVWNAVRGGIRDFRHAHPDEIMPDGNREASLVKRIVGQIESLAERWCGGAPNEAGLTAKSRGQTMGRLTEAPGAIQRPVLPQNLRVADKPAASESRDVSGDISGGSQG